MKRILPLLLIASFIGYAHQSSANPWLFINCAPNVPCTANGPINTHTGDAAYLLSYKMNTDVGLVSQMFGPSSHFATSGTVAASDIIGLWTNCSSSNPVLGYLGACVAGGSGGGLTSVGLSTTAAWLTVGSSPLTANGTITLTPTTGLTANEFLATPNGTTGAVGLRAMVAADLPASITSNTTGTAANITATSNATLTTLSALTSANGSSVPASAGTLPGSTGSFTLNDCLKVGLVSPLEVADAGAACGSGSMVYPAAGIPQSTGTAWGTSITPGTGVVTALGVNVGTAGAFVVNGGAGGTPSSLTLTNATGLPIAGISGLGSGMSSFLALAWPSLVSGDCLTNNGTALSWGACGSGSGSPGTPAYGLQVNNGSGAFGGIALPSTTGYYLINYSSLTAAPTLEGPLDPSMISTGTLPSTTTFSVAGIVEPSTGHVRADETADGTAWPTTCTGVGSWTSGGDPSCTTAGGGISIASLQISANQLCYAPTLTSNAYTPVASDLAQCLEVSNGATAATINLPQAGTTGFASGYFLYVVNYGTSTVTVKSTTSTVGGITGATGLVLNAGGTCKFSSDGTNWQTPTCDTMASSVGGIASAMESFAYGSIAAAADDYFVPGQGTAATSFALVPRAVTFTGITYYQATASNATGSKTVITLYTGAPGSLTASTLTCSVPLGGRSCNATGSVAVAANNAWQINVDNAGTSATGIMSFGVLYQ